jgi:hypothetical protein
MHGMHDLHYRGTFGHRDGDESIIGNPFVSKRESNVGVPFAV